MVGKFFGIRISAGTLFMAAILFTLPAVGLASPLDQTSPEEVSTTYVRILERVRMGDPFELIAGTVRDESETYPRPMALSTFCQEPFGATGCKASEVVDELLGKPEYADIHRFMTSNGAAYLYSDRFLSGDWAASIAERIEYDLRLGSNQ